MLARNQIKYCMQPILILLLPQFNFFWQAFFNRVGKGIKGIKNGDDTGLVRKTRQNEFKGFDDTRIQITYRTAINFTIPIRLNTLR